MTIDRPDLIGPETYLETIVDMGYTATETGPPGYFAPNGAAAVEKAGRFGVELIATFLPLRLDDAEGFEEDLLALDRTVEVLEATGGGILLLADMETPERARAAGSPERRRATGWDSDTFDRAAERLMHAAGLVTSRGLDVALHPHAATHIESEEEVEQLLERTPGLGLCIDTGHCVVGGGDPLALGAAPRRPDPPPAPEGRRRRAFWRRLAGGRGRHGRGVAARDLLRVRCRCRPAAGLPRRCPRCGRSTSGR